MSLALAPGGAAAQQAALYTISPADIFGDPDNQLRVIDRATGATLRSVPITLSGATVTGATGLATHPDTQDLYAVLKLSGQNKSQLATLDPATGVATAIGNTGYKFAGLAFDSTGTLYGVTGDGDPIAPETLFTLELSTATATPFLTLGDAGAGDTGESIAYNPDDGLLYRMSGFFLADKVLQSIDLATKTITPIPRSGDSYAQSQALTYLGSNTFLMADSDFEIYQITTGGVVTAVDIVDHVIKGLAIVRTTPQDFDRDLMSDILWRNTGTGTAVAWTMDGFTKTASATIGNVPLAWQVVDLGDFTSDGKADILWRNTGTGNALAWEMDGFTKVAAASIGSATSDWQIAGLGDFDGDGRSDVLWRNTSTGANIVWRMDGLARDPAGSGPIPGVATAWQVAGLGDFDRDGKTDILWRHSGAGTTVIWKMDGLSKAASVSLGAVPTVWEVAGVADLGGDGQADIVWRNGTTGTVVGWRIEALAKAASATVGTASLEWQIVRLGDYDGGRKADILWRNGGNGQNIIWLMNDLAKDTTGPIPTVPTVWEVQ